jgi:hypothetical protein
VNRIDRIASQQNRVIDQILPAICVPQDDGKDHCANECFLHGPIKLLERLFPLS